MRLGTLLASVVLLLSGCPSDRACTRNSECEAGSYCSGGACVTDCTPDTVEDDCGAGASCNTFGMCVSPPDAGPPPDAARSDGGVDAPDLRPACVIAGGVDADGDGYCAVGTDADCDDSDAAAHPGAAEVCTASVVGARPADENCDGLIDEACSWNFGRPHWVSRLMAAGVGGSPNYNLGPSLAPDGLTIYFAHAASFSTPGVVYVAQRPDLSHAFGVPRLITGPSFPGLVPGAPAMDREGSEVYFAAYPASAADGDIYRATRTSADTFSALERVPGLSTSDYEETPALSYDGLEIIVPSRRRLLRATRSTRSEAWSALEPVTFAPSPGLDFAEVNAPSLTPDGQTLFFYSRAAAGFPYRVYRAERTAPGASAFGAPSEMNALDGGVAEYVTPHVSAGTREMWFAAAGGWTPSGYAIWRAEICRDGPCTTREIECVTPGVFSADRLHCYSRVSSPQTWGNALSSCMDGHLATVHSAAERDVLIALIPSAYGWIGGYDGPGLAGLPDVPQCSLATPGCLFAWVTGEAFTYGSWWAGQPDNAMGIEDRVELAAAGMNDRPGTAERAALCERELWPTW